MLEGAATAYIRYLDDRLSMLVLTNCQEAEPESLVEGVAALLPRQPRASARRRPTRPVSRVTDRAAEKDATLT
jgi:hypothetical protein